MPGVGGSPPGGTADRPRAEAAPSPAERASGPAKAGGPEPAPVRRGRSNGPPPSRRGPGAARSPARGRGRRRPVCRERRPGPAERGRGRCPPGSHVAELCSGKTDRPTTAAALPVSVAAGTGRGGGSGGGIRGGDSRAGHGAPLGPGLREAAGSQGGASPGRESQPVPGQR